MRRSTLINSVLFIAISIFFSSSITFAGGGRTDTHPWDDMTTIIVDSTDGTETLSKSSIPGTGGDLLIGLSFSLSSRITVWLLTNDLILEQKKVQEIEIKTSWKHRKNIRGKLSYAK